MKLRSQIGIIATTSVLIASLVSTPAMASDSPTTVAALPDLLRVAAESASPPYERDRFEHWIDEDEDGCNTRFEVLIEESATPVSVAPPCSLAGGSWVSVYDGMAATSPSELEIDHVVALAEAWRSGAHAWTDAQRRAYANDIEVPYALVAVSGASNQSKDDSDPAGWMPSVSDYHCEYATGWALVKYRWSLAVDAEELQSLRNVLGGECGAAEVVLPAVMVDGGDAEVVPSSPPVKPFPSSHVRVGGADRYEVAINVSRYYEPGVPVVYLTKGTDFPDALSAAAAAALLGGPALLTRPTALPPGVLAELDRLQPSKIVVVGSEGSVSRSVFAELANRYPLVVRVGGADRYEASRNLTVEAFAHASEAMIATGRNFPDALAASGAAGKVGAPVLLVDGLKNEVPPATLDALRRLGISKVNIAGGAPSVSEGIAEHLRRAGFDVVRYGGPDRFAVAENINRAFFAEGAPATFFATAFNFPDALSGAALAGRIGAPLYVTRPACLPESTRSAADAIAPTNRVYLGGPSSVSDAVMSNIACLSASVPTIGGSVRVNSTLNANTGTWSPSTSFQYQWLANGAAIPGATGRSFTINASEAGKALSVRVTGTRSGFTTESLTSLATPRVTYPERTTPASVSSCPSWAPIKGNASSMIYHVPGGQFYARTNPEECFTTEAAARSAGYRKSQR
ncbi:cell wall-binding repeat-containing protein [Microbacterium aurantiacum]|uniref:cell wall-binding repeat-containing protein n=1 Tax=Microbacterium aurantiacum TaxID=162393 RepID=UPI0040355663